MTRACPHCGNPRDLEPISGGRVLCPVCAKHGYPVLVPDEPPNVE